MSNTGPGVSPVDNHVHQGPSCYAMGYDDHAEESVLSSEVMEYEKKLRVLRSRERMENLDKMKELIDEALKKSKSKNRPVNEKMKWMGLAGRLIVFKDQILKNQETELGMLDLMDLHERVKKLTEDSDEKPRAVG